MSHPSADVSPAHKHLAQRAPAGRMSLSLPRVYLWHVAAQAPATSLGLSGTWTHTCEMLSSHNLRAASAEHGGTLTSPRAHTTENHGARRPWTPSSTYVNMIKLLKLMHVHMLLCTEINMAVNREGRQQAAAGQPHWSPVVSRAMLAGSLCTHTTTSNKVACIGWS